MWEPGEKFCALLSLVLLFFVTGFLVDSQHSRLNRKEVYDFHFVVQSPKASTCIILSDGHKDLVSPPCLKRQIFLFQNQMKYKSDSISGMLICYIFQA